MSSLLRRALSVPLTLAALALPVLLPLATPASAATPSTPREPAAIEAFAPYQPQFLCRSTVEPGVKAFEKLVLATYPRTHSDGDMRACSDGGTSEHKDGRAWDWGADHRTASGRAAGEAMLRWLFATDSSGNTDAMYRRLGLMYIIWNHRIWEDGSWHPYSCSGVTLCHVDHMHFSFGWAGAEKKTSFWTHTVGQVVEPPLPRLTGTTTRRLAVTPGATVTAHWLLARGATYTLTVRGTSHTTAGTAVDAVCRKTSSGWQPSSAQLRVSGDQLGGWGLRLTPTSSDAAGCNTGTHAYRLTLTAAATSTLQVSLPGSGSGHLSVAVHRAA
jgi:hypothetical protein